MYWIQDRSVGGLREKWNWSRSVRTWLKPEELAYLETIALSSFSGESEQEARVRKRFLARESNVRGLKTVQDVFISTEFFKKKLFMYSWSTMMCYFHVFNYTHTHMYIYSFSDSFPIEVITEYWVEFPMLYSRSLLVIYFIYSSVYILIPNSQFIPTSPPLTSTEFWIEW